MTHFTDDYRTDLEDYDYCGDDYLTDDTYLSPEPTEPEPAVLVPFMICVLANRAFNHKGLYQHWANHVCQIQYPMVPLPWLEEHNRPKLIDG